MSSTPRQATIRGFQERVRSWVLAAFGVRIADDLRERNHRFFKEACELVQALDLPEDEAHALVRYVYSRQKGEPAQECSGVLITLCALSSAHHIDLSIAAEQEMARVWEKIDRIREKQKEKPKVGEINQLYPERSEVGM